MMAAAEERPWLWVVYILTVALPVFLVVLFCCSGKVCTFFLGFGEKFSSRHLLLVGSGSLWDFSVCF